MDHIKALWQGIVYELGKIRFHSSGYPFMGLALAGWFLLFPYPIFGLFVGWVFYFFRHPRRVIAHHPHWVVSPGDGEVCDIALDTVLPGDTTQQRYHKVSIFLNIFDVHVNRLPVGGRITGIEHQPGSFLHAADPKASESNERLMTWIQCQNHTFVCVQVAGWIARRILCQIKKGESYAQGHPYGIIRFGSRMDVYMPVQSQIWVKKGQKLRGGESLMATFHPQQQGTLT